MSFAILPPELKEDLPAPDVELVTDVLGRRFYGLEGPWELRLCRVIRKSKRFVSLQFNGGDKPVLIDHFLRLGNYVLENTRSSRMYRSLIASQPADMITVLITPTSLLAWPGPRELLDEYKDTEAEEDILRDILESKGNVLEAVKQRNPSCFITGSAVDPQIAHLVPQSKAGTAVLIKHGTLEHIQTDKNGKYHPIKDTNGARNPVADVKCNTVCASATTHRTLDTKRLCCCLSRTRRVERQALCPGL